MEKIYKKINLIFFIFIGMLLVQAFDQTFGWGLNQMIPKIYFTTFGKIDPDNYFSGSAIPLLIVGWLVTYFVSYFIKPKFISSKAFIIAWLLILGSIAAVTIANIIDPPFYQVYGGMSYPIHKDIWQFIIPTGIFIWFVKDKEKGLYSLDEKWLRNEKTDDKI